MTRERLPLPETSYLGGKGFLGSDMHAYSDAENAALSEQVRVLREALIRCESCTTNDGVGQQARTALEKTK